MFHHPRTIRIALTTGLIRDRTDKVQTAEDKVNKVRQLLGKE